MPPKVPFIQLESHAGDAQPHARHGGVSEPEEGVHDAVDPLQSVQPDAHLGHPDRERRRVRPFPVAALNRLVRNEPGVAAAAQVVLRPRPSADVGLVLVLHSDRESIELDVPVPGQVEDVLVAVVDVAPAVDRLVVACGDALRRRLGVTGTSASGRAGRAFGYTLRIGNPSEGALGLPGVDGDRLDPVQGVLQREPAPEPLQDLEGPPGLGRFARNVEEQRSAAAQHPVEGVSPRLDPVEVLGSRDLVVV